MGATKAKNVEAETKEESSAFVDKYQVGLKDEKQLKECTQLLDDATYDFLRMIHWVANKFPQANIILDSEQENVLKALATRQ